MAQLNHGTHIGNIMDRQACPKHKSPKGIPCFHLYTGPDSMKIMPAICNRRAVLAGANGTISQSSYTSRNTAPRRERRAA